jgi:hypothetical protein
MPAPTFFEAAEADARLIITRQYYGNLQQLEKDRQSVLETHHRRQSELEGYFGPSAPCIKPS